VTDDVLAKFDRIAAGYSEHDYADPERYAQRRADVILALGRDRRRPRVR